jgi:hypothetical protein
MTIWYANVFMAQKICQVKELEELFGLKKQLFKLKRIKKKKQCM